MGGKKISGECQRCGTWRPHLQRDHVTPKYVGGSDLPDNIQLLCANCHEDKTDEDRVTHGVARAYGGEVKPLGERKRKYARGRSHR